MVALRHFAPYRALRVAQTVGGALVRYYRLERRDRRGSSKPTTADWERLHDQNARAVHDLVVELRGVFVKGCQILGARADLLPRPYIEHLGRFHDRVPPRPFAELKKYVERELGRPIEAVFSHLDEKPLAAASLAQVHRAHLKDGTEVAVKIQYPEVPRLFPVDLANIRRAARVVERTTKILPLSTLAGELTQFVRLELDFLREADAMERIARNFAGDPVIAVPRIFREYCTDKVLVLGFLHGIKITDIERLRAEQVDLAEVCRKVAHIYVTMIFDHGFFHADPHPGNLLVLPDGRIGLLDFGLNKQLPPGFADGLARLLLATVNQQTAEALEAARALGFELRDGAEEEFLKLIGQLFYPRGLDATFGLLGDAGPLRVPSDITLVLRSLILLNGLSYQLAPGEYLLQQAVLRALASRSGGNGATVEGDVSCSRAPARSDE